MIPEQEAFANGGYRVSQLVLKKIVMHTCPKMDPDGGCDPYVMHVYIHTHKTYVYECTRELRWTLT